MAARTGDASDATLEVLHDQIARHGGQAVGWTRVDASGPTEAAATAWVAAKD